MPRERPELKLSSHERNIKKFGRPTPEIQGLVHKETCSFHLLVGEVTITLDNVALLLHLPITGAFHNFEVLHVDKLVQKKQKLRQYNAMRHTYNYPGYETFIVANVTQHSGL
ncbi:hypothetical protein GmHk_17G049911 [Glycine max]|nr:hypothetical protein GmHk_17G049911 [Glycine max]